MNFIEQHTQQIKTLCTQHKVRRLYVFGSALTKDFNGESDLDFIVDFQPLEISQYVDNYFNLKFSLEDTLHRPVDLLEEKAIRNPYFKKALEDQRQLVYGY
jgi:predicted nucleotidyltransferase